MVWCIRTTKTDVSRLCVAHTKLKICAGTHWRGLETSLSGCGHQGFSLHSEETNKVRFFLILSRVKKLSKSNDVYVQNILFL